MPQDLRSICKPSCEFINRPIDNFHNLIFRIPIELHPDYGSRLPTFLTDSGLMAREWCANLKGFPGMSTYSSQDGIVTEPFETICLS